ncbi:MAG: molecular chaperone DnaJ, partial [Peptococcaceae bacterium]|nr:molecular chaperone DnaJ [Peptococcaceae bacterium]
NPLADLAEEKMKEINEAYDTIIASRKGRHTNSGYSTNTSSEFADIRAMISANRIEEARELLDGVDISRRSAEWYFLNGTVLYKRGWFDDAYTSFATACRMDPSNMEYRAAFQRMSHQRGGGFNTGGYRTYRGGNDGCTGCGLCGDLICADCCCECMGGDLIPCC